VADVEGTPGARGAGRITIHQYGTGVIEPTTTVVVIPRVS
jgi:hypothetical protein